MCASIWFVGCLLLALLLPAGDGGGDDGGNVIELHITQD